MLGGTDGLHAYGSAPDLAGNLEKVIDGSGRVLVRNVYGTDPHAVSFDAVVEQYIGDNEKSIRFGYMDFDPPETAETSKECYVNAAGYNCPRGENGGG